MDDSEQLTFWSEEAPASLSQLQEKEQGYRANQAVSCSSIYEQFATSCKPAGGGAVRATSSGKTCQGRLVPKRELRSDSYSRSWMNSGTVWRGEYSMRSLSEYPTGRLMDSSGRLRSAAGVSTLSEFLEARTPQKYSLSAKACAGIIRRAKKRVKPLPPMLLNALESVIALDSNASEQKRETAASLCSASRNVVCIQDGQTNGTICDDGTATTLNASHENPIIIDRAAFNQGENAKYPPHIEQTDTMDTLVARGPHAVCHRTSMA